MIGDDDATLESLVAEMRETAITDIELVQRVALVCCKLIEEKEDPTAAIWTVFRIQ